ncbi:MAG: biotin/lipoyl-containing protein [Syntrophales bacterium]
MVSVKDEVKFDDEIIVLEAMKMNNPICASTNETIKEVRVKEEDKVKTGQVLVVLE